VDLGIDALDWAARATRLGAGEILLTSMDRDGTNDGYDLDLLAAVRRRADIPIIASGGAGTPDHLAEALDTGRADAVLAASIFHRDRYTVGGMKALLAERGVPIREVAA
jgi:cyclase